MKIQNSNPILILFRLDNANSPSAGLSILRNNSATSNASTGSDSKRKKQKLDDDKEQVKCLFLGLI